jgi:hypothetical protein
MFLVNSEIIEKVLKGKFWKFRVEENNLKTNTESLKNVWKK